MKKNTTLLFWAFIVFSFHGFSQGALPTKDACFAGKSWTINQPFQRNVFIENNGQFSEEEKKAVGSKIVYYSHIGSLYLYFTPTGLIFRRDSVYKAEDDNDQPGEKDDKDGLWKLRTRHCFTKMQWQGCNQNTILQVENETPDYFTFPNHADRSGKSGIKAKGWTKLVYKNLYNGIDVEFFYPEGKVGIEYNIIVHPGADPARAKILYSGSSINLSGQDVKINTGWDILTDHAPTAKVENGNSVPASFNVTGKTISFNIGSYDKSQTLVIDPFISATTLGGTNQAYDLGYDYLGNVFVYGGGPSNYYELQKYNSAGGLVWTFVNNAFTYLYSTGYFYGGLTVDHNTGTSYMCEGFGPPNNHVVQVNYSGAQTALWGGNGTDEMWRIGYDYCNNQLVLCTGGSTIPDACHLDTNCTNFQIQNIGSSSDESMLAFDNIGNCYLGNCRMVFGGGANHVFKLPCPSLFPVTYSFVDKHDIEEITNIS
ncbi:MAG TPA: hypothetical protein VK808_12805, partial [Bacteroidia bacterium]|nr:hypothetical protein [Bacteroidia bacterium]